jgi:hypothetical protein
MRDALPTERLRDQPYGRCRNCRWATKQELKTRSTGAVANSNSARELDALDQIISELGGGRMVRTHKSPAEMLPNEARDV